MDIHEILTFAFHLVTKGLASRPLHVSFKTEEELFARALAHGPKTVDVPASLPTPPHNNQEELRSILFFFGLMVGHIVLLVVG